MISSDDTLNQQTVCPGLGLVYDQSDHSMVANPLHNCYFQTKPEVIPLVHQETYCLSENYNHCPIYLKKITSIPLVTTTNVAENQKPDRRAFRLSRAQSLSLITVLLSILLIILLVLLITSPNNSRQSVSSSSGDPLTVITYIISPTNITPNATWYAQLTQQAMLSETPTLMSGSRTRTSIAYQNPTVIYCDQPDGWIIYQVDYGDTLASLGRLTYMTVVDLMVANCMTVNSLEAGQEIFLPYYPGSATATRTAFPTPTRTRTATPTSPGGPTSIPVLPSNTSPPPATATNTIVPTVTNTKNPLFRDTPTPSRTPLPTATNPPIASDTP